MFKSKSFIQRSRRSQLGNGLIYAMLGLALVSAATAAFVTRQTELAVVRDGSIEGGAANVIAAAAATYVTEQYSALQPSPALAVTKNGFTLPAAQVFNPTVAQLNSLGYLTNTGDTAVSTNAGYVIQISRTPLGCIGAACDLSGQVYLDRPILRTASGELDGSFITGWLNSTGANGGYSTPGNAAQITGPGWTAANPVSGQPQGIVAVRFGFGASGLGQFARTTDSRPINFQNNFQVGGNTTVVGSGTFGGNLNVAGNAAVAGNSSVAGNSTVNGSSTFGGPVTINNSLTVSGPINNGCFKTTGASGRISTNCLDPDDVPAGSQGGIRTGDVIAGGGANNVVGVLRPGATGASGNFAAYLTASGDTVATGRARGNELVPTGYFAPGSACANPGALANNANASGWVACQNGVWFAIATQASVGGPCSPEFSEASATSGDKLVCVGGAYVPASSLYSAGSAGGACPVEGKQGFDTGAQYSQLLCRKNPAVAGAPLLWYRTQDLTSFKEYVGGGLYAHGDTIPKPSCSAVGSTPRQAIIDFVASGATASSDAAFNERAIDNGTSWTMSLTNGSGQPLTSNTGFATKQVNFFCYTY